jgi:hypothetical protein
MNGIKILNQGKNISIETFIDLLSHRNHNLNPKLAEPEPSLVNIE